MYAELLPATTDLACSASVMADALGMARMSAAIDGAVLIVGERGSGKETVGRYVHQHSTRAAGPFVPVDCQAMAIDPAWAVAELVGRSRGSGPGATRDSLGLVRAADGGTLYLDEVSALDLPSQRLLVRLVRTAAVERLGDRQRFPVDVRLIAATSTDVSTLVARGLLAAELRDLLSPGTVRVPPLRDRSADLPDLAHSLLRARGKAFGEGAKTLTAPAAAALRSYRWPGNLPELARMLDAAATRARGRQIDVADLPGTVGSAARPTSMTRPLVRPAFVPPRQSPLAN